MLHIADATIESYNSTSLVTNYRAFIPPTAPTQNTVDVNEVYRNDVAPLYGGKTIKGRIIPIKIIVYSGGSVDTLKALFDVSDTSLRTLVVKDYSDNKEWYVLGTPATPPTVSEGKNLFETSLYVADAVYKSVEDNVDTWTISDGAGSITVISDGNKDAYPEYEFTMSGLAPSGYAYRRHFSSYNQTDSTLDDWMEDITISGLDTSALVSGGKMETGGADILLLVDGQKADYWLSATPPNATTKIWTNIDYSPKKEFTLRTALDNSTTPATINFVDNAVSRAYFRALPRVGCIRIDNEEITYSGKNLKNMYVVPVERAVRDTTIAAHLVGATVRWIEHEVVLLYGNPAATAQTMDDTRKPIINLSSSTHTSHVYEEFKDKARLRTGRWASARAASTGGASVIYTDNRGTDADLATECGMKAQNWTLAGRPQAESFSLWWRKNYPCGIVSVTTSGEKYRSTVDWPTIASLQSSPDGVAYTTVWTEATPASATTWTSFTENAAAGTVASGTISVRYLFKGSLGARNNNISYFEIGASTLVLTPTGIPVKTLRAETANNWFDATITNTSTGESFSLFIPTKAGDVITVDTDNKLIKKNGYPALSFPTLSTTRNTWLRLQSGSNNITYSSTTGGDINATISWKDRSL